MADMKKALPKEGEEWLERVFQVAEETRIESGWWYMSFTDPDLPKGTQFLGACYVDGPTLPAALTRSHDLGINPGGEVAFVEVPSDVEIPENLRLRLLSREEAEGF